MIAVLLAGCAHQLGIPAVTYGTAMPVPLVRTEADARWFVPLEVDGQGSWVLFVDTGYSYSTCDDGLIEALGLPARGRTVVRGELGRLTVKKARLPRLELGGHMLDGLVCQVRDLGSTSSIRDPREVRVAGVIGMDVLRPFTVRMDPVAARLTLETPGGHGLVGDGVVRIRREQRVGIRALVPLEVGGSTIWPVLDTGASGTHLRAERLGLVPARVREGVTVRGTGEDGQAVRTVAYYELEDVALGGIDAGPVVATGRDRGPGAGLLGLNVLGRYLAVYDFRAGEALFERVESSPLLTWTEWSRMREGPVRLAAPPVR